ncbi:MAG: thiamine pyrophosphate-binding protein, partial [Christensenellales bacterium]
MKLTGSQIIIECLLEQGVDTVFGYPGGAVLNIYDELFKHSDRITHYVTCHEQGAAHAADGYARVSGKVGVVMATSGPGATNLVTGIAAAYLDSTPLVAITGNVATGLLGRDSFQEVDIAGVTMPITKHNYIVRDVETLADTIREAFHVARSGRPGPVLIDVPKDVQTGQAEYERAVPAPREETPVCCEQVQRAVEMIQKAKRPFIYCGGGVVIAGASSELQAFAERIDAPIGASMMGLSAVPSAHPRFLGMVGMHGRYAATKALYESDLLIAVGARFSDRATGKKSEFSSGRQVLQIDIDPAEISKNIPSNNCIIGD